MVKAPAAGGWGTSHRTGGLKIEGFTDAEIAAALDHCDNDRVKCVAYLNKRRKQTKEWRPIVAARRDAMQPGVLRDALTRLLDTKAATQGLPQKQKAFQNCTSQTVGTPTSLISTNAQSTHKPIINAHDNKQTLSTNARVNASLHIRAQLAQASERR
uniref:Uncharacterized protein n=1 Tax=Pycnococcus provasolii TaxID=41880 RepID=A0A7S2YWL5_9CHLO